MKYIFLAGHLISNSPFLASHPCTVYLFQLFPPVMIMHIWQFLKLINNDAKA